VAGRLSGLSNDSLVRQIETKLGDDLQYIRLNGALLGFLIGLVLTTLLQAAFR
jgi:uncharacterized membrane-anchored protein YjiN (DUF445 family)